MPRKPKESASESELTIERFEAMSPRERQAVLAEIESMTPAQRRAESRPLNAAERAKWAGFQNRVKKQMGRPRIGEGSTVVSLSVEKDLLKKADAFAKAHGLGRSELFRQGLRNIIGAKAAG